MLHCTGAAAVVRVQLPGTGVPPADAGTPPDAAALPAHRGRPPRAGAYQNNYFETNKIISAFWIFCKPNKFETSKRQASLVVPR